MPSRQTNTPGTKKKRNRGTKMERNDQDSTQANAATGGQPESEAENSSLSQVGGSLTSRVSSLSDVRELVMDNFERRPVTTLLAVAGVGFVLGKAITHRWSRNLMFAGLQYGVANASGLFSKLGTQKPTQELH